MGSRLEKNSDSVRKRIESHSFHDEGGEEYEGSKFGGFSDYFRRKKIKLQNLDVEIRSSSTGKLQIFRGVVAHVNGYTQPSLNELHKLIVSHGGGFMQYLDGKTTVTHIIAANLTPKKAVEFRKYRIVKPAWVVDSIAAGKLLPWDAYRVLDEGSGQRLLGFEEGKVTSQANTSLRSYREQTNTGWYASQVKAFADDVNARDGAQFLNTRPVAQSGLESEFSHQRQEPLERAEAKNLEDVSSSAESFEVTTSLEAALENSITDKTPSRRKNSTTGSLTPPPQVTSVLNSVEVEPLQESEPKVSPIETIPAGKDMKHSPEPQKTYLSREARVLTAEEHNALLLADPHIRKSSTANPDFIKQYYAESRLHHLSAWKADLKSRFQQMAAEKSAPQIPATKRKPGARRYVMHVDFDSFFCAVSLKKAPDYIDKPAVVAHGTGTGSEIASCNYPARAFGVKNGMWMKTALGLCPDIKVLPYDFPAYEEASRGFYEAILDIGGIVQSVSVDEALVDITSLCLSAGGTSGVGIGMDSIRLEQEKADEIGHALQKKIKEKTSCAVSIGIGGNILLAKVALRKAKPAGQHQIKPEDILDFLSELSVRDLPGVAYSIGGKLEEIGVKNVKDVRQLTKDRLMTVLGPKTGEKIWDYSRGVDRAEVGEQVVRKSVSAEVNWGIRFISQPEAEEFVQNLCIELQRRLIDQNVKGRQFTMKIMKKAADAPLDPPKHLGHGKCDTFNKSAILGVATNSAEIIGREAISILRSFGFSPGELRGLGVQMTKLEPIKVSSIPDGSQRRINFTTAAPKPSKQVNNDPIDDPQTPKKKKPIPVGQNKSVKISVEDPVDEIITLQKPKFGVSRFLGDSDPIDDLESPQKAKVTSIHPAAAIVRANATDRSAKKLNITGTQFMVPTQIDPNVLFELPLDIRSKLMAQSKSKSGSRSISPSVLSRSASPMGQEHMALPSQLDPEVFEALPEDMKVEVLASYALHEKSSRGQSLLPQSPRKVRTININKIKTPTKKRGRPPGSKNRPKQDSHSNFTQSNFITKIEEEVENAKEQAADGEGYSSDTLDTGFLSALPEDVREEIIHKHKQTRHTLKSGLVDAPSSEIDEPPDDVAPDEVMLELPPREPRPTFTTQELNSLPELRDTLSSWYTEFADDGPHIDDVGAMERYLKRVVLDERDMEKAVGIIRWISWLIEEADEGNPGTQAWAQVLDGLKEQVQEAVRERGLGKLEL